MARTLPRPSRGEIQRPSRPLSPLARAPTAQRSVVALSLARRTAITGSVLELLVVQQSFAVRCSGEKSEGGTSDSIFWITAVLTLI